MNDEKFVFIQDLREKKMTARGASHKRTHNGKGGAVKLTSDYLSKKELKTMSSETTTYRLNDPLKWDEYKTMPYDIKRTYIESIRNKYNAPGSRIANMLGVSYGYYSREINRLGISEGKGKRGKDTKWDKDGFEKWCASVSNPVEESRETSESFHALESLKIPDPKENPKSIPVSGRMHFECKADCALNTVLSILSGQNVRLSVTWSVITENGSGDSDV